MAIPLSAGRPLVDLMYKRRGNHATANRQIIENQMQTTQINMFEKLNTFFLDHFCLLSFADNTHARFSRHI